MDEPGTFVPLFEEPRLLVVDDEESLRITTAAIFENEGYLVDTASTSCSQTCTWKEATVFQFSTASGARLRSRFQSC
jgi:ActR/RegA family two-component response regulator